MILSVIASEAKQSTAAKETGLLRRCAPRNDDGAAQAEVVTALPAEYHEASPNAQRDRPGCRTNARACLTVDASRPTTPGAIPLQAGSAGRQNRRRSSGIRCAACSRRSPRRTCIRKSRCALPQNAGEDPCRNIRSSAGVAAPWSSRRLKQGGSSQIKRWTRMPKIPRFRPSRHQNYRRNSLSGSLELSFNRSSTIDERTCATLWCGISTLLTISERLFRSRSTTFNR
jgi:hypothetical protein